MSGPVLWLLRHGKAADSLGVADAGRPLTPRGEVQSVLAGQLLRTLSPTLNAVLTSPRVRARRTAEIAARSHGAAPAPRIVDELGGDYGLHDLLAITSPWLAMAGDLPPGPGSFVDDGSEAPAVLVVGHNPTLTVLAHELTGDARGMSTGTIVGIDLLTREVIAHIRPDA